MRLLSQRDLVLIGSLGELITVRTIANKVISALLHHDNCNVLENTANILIKEEEVDADENLSDWQREGPVLTMLFLARISVSRLKLPRRTYCHDGHVLCLHCLKWKPHIMCGCGNMVV